jgi:4-hydroxy-4-methyl-2-oxoglutarate aldolase
MSAQDCAELARLGTATVYEGGGRRGLIDVPLIQVVAGSRAAGPARTVRCAQGDNLMVHAAMAGLQPGEVLVVTMPEPAPVGLVGDLLATQAKVHGAAAMLIDAAVRDVEELAALGLPIWARLVRARGPNKKIVGELDVPVEVGGTTIRPGDVVVLDTDGAAVVEQERIAEALAGAQAREEAERVKRAKLQEGALSYDLDGLRAIVEDGGGTPPSAPAQGAQPPGGGTPWA